MGRATGIEITETAVRVVELDGTDRKHKLLGTATVPLGSGDSETGQTSEQLGAAARAALRAAKAKREQLVLGLPARDVIIREIVIPFTEPEQIRKVIKFESESHLPSTNIDEVVVGFYKISETGPRSRLLIFAVEKKTLRDHLEALGRVGVEPTQVDLSSTALYSLATLISDLECTDEDDTSANVILDVGEQSTTLVLTQGPRLRMIRSMRLGSETLIRTLSSDLGIDTDEARSVVGKLLQPTEPFGSAGDAGDSSRDPSTALTATEIKTDIIQDKESEFARRIVNELRRTLSSVQVEGQLKGIWLTGPGSTAAGLERELRDAFRVHVAALDVLSTGDHKADAEAATYAGPAIGLALKAFEHDPIGLEFRQEEFAYARKLDRVRNPLLLASFLILVLLAFLSILEWKNVQALDKDVRFIADQCSREFQLHIGGLASSPKNAKYMGYTPSGAEEPGEAEVIVEDMTRQLKAGQYPQVLTTARQSLYQISKHLEDYYGVQATEGSRERPPEEIATSALVRLESWVTVMNRLRNEKKVYFKLEKLNISDENITWTMRVPSEMTVVTLDFFDAEFQKMPDFDAYKPGQSKPLGPEREIAQSRVTFKRGY